ncbi:hypothetical protein F4778DRAFT_17706 [Xylariomycetidae sp. FL2044]|nr:hypothetical protein F4778DRAFT_17706 [Xylariomycetidae sp. FL2044]
MATRHELGALPKRKLMTYGKAARKRQPRSTCSPVTASKSASEEDLLTASKTTTTPPKNTPKTMRRQPPIDQITSRKSFSPELPQLLDGANDDPAKRPSSQSTFSSERKRKLSHIYPSQGRPQGSSNSSDDSSSSTPERHRNGIPKNEGARKSTLTARIHVQSPAADSMDVDIVEPRLSSPPPTPTPPKIPKALSRTGTRGTIQSSITTIKETRRETPGQQQIALHLARDRSDELNRSNPSITSRKDSRRPITKTSSPVPHSRKKPRRRLIDALVEQTPEDSADTDYEEDHLSSHALLSQPSSTQDSNVSAVNFQNPPVTPNSKPRTAQTTGTRTFARSSSALKFTYGQGRKLLEEEEDNLLEALSVPEMPQSLKGRRLELGGPKKSTAAGWDLDDDDDLTSSPNAKLRDIHELRQAGANSRVADSMQDLKDQMGVPTGRASSARRAALLQVAERIKDKTFMLQCRDHGVEAAVLKEVGNETDSICSLLIVSMLVTMSAKWPSGHPVRLLRLEEAAPMFSRLLLIRDDIKKLVRDRKNNLSKRSQTSIISIQKSLAELPIWEGGSPTLLSPRSIAIKCLHLLISQDPSIGNDPAVYSGGVTEGLFDVLREAAEEPQRWTNQEDVMAAELSATLSALDFHAVTAENTLRQSSEWASKYLPIVADVLRVSLQHAPLDNAKLESSILKLTINVTNNSVEAPDIFASKGLLPALAGSIANNFRQVLATIIQDSWTEGVLDGLVLQLGILINFSEHSALVRQVVNDCQYNSQHPVDEFIKLFVENHRRTSEADSMEKSHLNVAFGYLSVLLGYLALYAPVRQKLRSGHSSRSIGPLIDSIREFIAHYKKVENAMDDDDAPSEDSGTRRLQQLVHELEDQAAYD